MVVPAPGPPPVVFVEPPADVVVLVAPANRFGLPPPQANIVSEPANISAASTDPFMPLNPLAIPLLYTNCSMGQEVSVRVVSGQIAVGGSS